MSDKKKYSVGGQALMEGIMMNGPKGVAMALRMPDGSIETQLKNVTLLKDKYKIFKVPFIRGPVNFVEQMIFGYKCLMESAEKTTILEDGAEEEMSKLDKWLSDHMGPKMMTAITGVASVLAVLLGAGLFVFLPTYLVDIADAKLFDSALASYHALFEGIIRMIIMVAYMFAVSQMKDIKRVFMYHGAEHKSIFCYEKGLELTVENVRSCKRFHPRCGTSFIFVVLIISVIVSSLVLLVFPVLRDDAYRLPWMIIKIVGILPVVTAISYEFIKYAGKHDNILTKILSAPGLWMQRITTKEPDDSMIEVAITSIKAVITDNPEDDRL